METPHEKRDWLACEICHRVEDYLAGYGPRIQLKCDIHLELQQEILKTLEENNLFGDPANPRSEP